MGASTPSRPTSPISDSRAAALLGLLTVQAAAALFFVVDIAGDVGRWSILPNQGTHHAVEIAAALALIAGIVLISRQIGLVLRRQRRIEAQLRAASGAFFEVIEEHFARWRLTKAERDVALLAIRGMSIAEIAAARRTRCGTVKAQCAAVYAKAGVSSRSQLLSLFIDELLAARPAGEQAPAQIPADEKPRALAKCSRFVYSLPDS